MTASQFATAATALSLLAATVSPAFATPPARPGGGDSGGNASSSSSAGASAGASAEARGGHGGHGGHGGAGGEGGQGGAGYGGQGGAGYGGQGGNGQGGAANSSNSVTVGGDSVRAYSFAAPAFGNIAGGLENCAGVTGWQLGVYSIWGGPGGGRTKVEFNERCAAWLSEENRMDRVLQEYMVNLQTSAGIFERTGDATAYGNAMLYDAMRDPARARAFALTACTQAEHWRTHDDGNDVRLRSRPGEGSRALSDFMSHMVKAGGIDCKTVTGSATAYFGTVWTAPAPAAEGPK